MGGIGGDISAEPSMEEILSSIKRIIAEEGEGTQLRARRPQRTPVSLPDPEPDEVLELSEPLARAEPAPVQRLAEPAAPPRESEPAAAEPAEPIVSHAAAAASRGSLEALSRLVVKPDGSQADATLEGLVREMLRPMLRDWLDARLPEMVEAMVAREIERITGSR